MKHNVIQLFLWYVRENLSFVLEYIFLLLMQRHQSYCRSRFLLLHCSPYFTIIFGVDTSLSSLYREYHSLFKVSNIYGFDIEYYIYHINTFCQDLQYS